MKNIKKDFPFFIHNPEITYLDNAATTNKPGVVIDRIVKFYAQENASVYRGIYQHAEAATQNYENVREQVRAFIGAEYAEEIIFTANATAASNLVVNAWGRANLQQGDEIILTQLEHHAQLVPWMQLAQEKGLILKMARVNAEGGLDYTHFMALVSNKTKLIAITAASNVTGAWIDIAKVASAAKIVDIKVLIDACQAAPRCDLKEMAQISDFLFFSGHKMFGPGGIGVLFVKRKNHAKMIPCYGGGGTVLTVDHTIVWRDVPYRYEAGTVNAAAVIGLGAAMRYMQENIDFIALCRHESALCEQLISFLETKNNVKILGSVDQLKQTGHMVSFVVDGMHPHDIAYMLDQKGICVRSGNHCAQPLHKALGVDASLRASFYAYTTYEDVEKLIQTLKYII